MINGRWSDRDGAKGDSSVEEARRRVYAMKDGSPVAAPLIAELRESSNPGMVESLRGVVTRTWGTEAEALAAAQEVA
jgi:hypothetical protein